MRYPITLIIRHSRQTLSSLQLPKLSHRYSSPETQPLLLTLWLHHIIQYTSSFLTPFSSSGWSPWRVALETAATVKFECRETRPCPVVETMSTGTTRPGDSRETACQRFRRSELAHSKAAKSVEQTLLFSYNTLKSGHLL